MNDKYVTGIGAANVDIYCKSEIEIRKHYDHPSHITVNSGGVTRNILEALSRLSVKTVLLTAVGDDIFKDKILNDSKKAGMDVSHVKTVKGLNSGIFMQVQDENNDMHLAMCDMSVNEYIDIPYLKSKDEILKNSSVIVIDPSLKEEIIEYLLDAYEDIPFFIDPVSDEYARKMKKYIGRFHACKPNITECEILSGMKIENDVDLHEASDKLIKAGLKEIYVTMGRNGCYYTNGSVRLKKGLKTHDKIINASGAGDCFFAAMIYGYIKGLKIEDTLKYALVSAHTALYSDKTINEDLSEDLLKRMIKENENEFE